MWEINAEFQIFLHFVHIFPPHTRDKLRFIGQIINNPVIPSVVLRAAN